jgi:hypothetical protein
LLLPHGETLAAHATAKADDLAMNVNIRQFAAGLTNQADGLLPGLVDLRTA